MKTSRRVVIVGSINIDHVYRVDKAPRPGQSLPVLRYERHLGGKGMNQAWAMWQAGLRSVEMHAIIGTDGLWVLSDLEREGFPIKDIRVSDSVSTGQVVIIIPEGEQGEVASVYHFAANLTWSIADFELVVSSLQPDDLLVLQNEINQVETLIAMARAKGVTIVFNPAPALSPDLAVYRQVDYLILNEAEAEELTHLFAFKDLSELRDLCPNWIVTLGAHGLRAHLHGQDYELPTPLNITATDTVGAGDCFLGYWIAGWCQGMEDQEALIFAMKAAAITCTRDGAFAAIPRADELP